MEFDNDFMKNAEAITRIIDPKTPFLMADARQLIDTVPAQAPKSIWSAWLPKVFRQAAEQSNSSIMQALPGIEVRHTRSDPAAFYRGTIEIVSRAGMNAGDDSYYFFYYQTPSRRHLVVFPLLRPVSPQWPFMMPYKSPPCPDAESDRWFRSIDLLPG